MAFTAIASLFVILFFLIPYYVYRTAFYSPPKKHPKPEDPMKGRQYHEVEDNIRLATRVMEKFPFEPVTIDSFDGTKLYGRYYHLKDGAPVEILFHGYRSCAFRDCSGGHALARKMGFNTLVVDQRAHGESGGRVITFGVKERLDCVRWAEYIDRRVGGEIILDGLSMGATTVLMAAGEQLPASVKGVIADCGFTSPKEIMLKVMESDLKIRCRPLFYLVALMVRLRAGFDVDEYSTIEAMKRNRLPILFLHGTEDKFVPCGMTKSAYEACASEKTLVLIEGAGHGTSYLKEPETCREALQAFLKKHTGE